MTKTELTIGMAVAALMVAIFLPAAETKNTEPIKPPTQTEVEAALQLSADVKTILNRTEGLAITLGRIEKRLADMEIAGNTQEPEPVTQEPEQAKTIVRFYTADDSWQCLACEQQKKKLKANPPSFEYETIRGPSEGKSPTGKYPTWEVIRPDGSKSIREGQYAVESLNQWVNGNSQVRYTFDELRQWVRDNYHQTSSLMADVKPRSSVWRHLQDSNHGFTSAQVTGLSQWEALRLHDAHHQERITPYRGSAKAIPVRPLIIKERPSYANRSLF